MNSSIPTNRFLCPHCNEKSKLPDPIPESGLFKISCAHCGNQCLIRFSNYNYNFEKKIDQPQKPSSESRFNIFQKLKLGVIPKNKPKEEPPKFFNSLKDRASVKLNNSLSYPTSSTPNSSTKSYYLTGLYWGGLSLLLITILFFAYLGTGILQTKSELNPLLANLSKGKPTKITCRNGQVISEIFQKRISTLRLEEYPDHLITALLNVEDKGFYSHGGVDITALFRALFTNIIHLRFKQGASTITQQLARIMLDDRRKSLSRKWKELELALTLETYLTKDQILEYYMNNVYLGHGAYGFGEAIKFYFKKNPSEITKTEAILLATLASAPNRNSPLRSPESSKERLDYIIKTFRNRGVISEIPHNEISNIYHQLATRSPNETVYGNRKDLAPYITEHVRVFLQNLSDNVNIYDQGGYIVETTILSDVQKNLENIVYSYLQNLQRNGSVRKTHLTKVSSKETVEIKAMKNLLKDSSLALEIFSSTEYTEELQDNNDTLQSAIIGLEPETGEVLFVHGGDKFQAKNQFNRAVQMRRQTGSSIKPILYSSAINSGIITTADKILDAPLIYRGVQGLPNWTPDNIGKNYDGEIGIRFALVKSKNTAAVQIAEKLGFQNLDHYFSVFFFPNRSEKTKRFRNDLSLSLGSLELSPLEMASAFGSFSNQGKIIRPHLIRKVIAPNGKIVYERGSSDEFDLKVPEERTVIKPDTAEVMISLLKDSARSSGVFRNGYRGVVAGKTGTTNENRDAWFIGLRPGLTMAIWIGYDNPSFGMGAGGLGGSVAAPLWGEIAKMADKEKSIPVVNFPYPTYAVAVKVCGNLKSSCGDCPQGMEWFIRDNIKSDSCSSNLDENEGKREVLQELF